MAIKYFDRSKDRRSFLKTSGAIALVAAGGGTLAACGGGGGGGGTGAAPTPATPATPSPPPPIVATTNGTATLAPARNGAQAVASETWKNQLKIQITPVGATRPTLFELSNQGQRMDDLVRPGGVANSAYYRVDLGFAIPGLWLALHYSPVTPTDSTPHASYVFEHQPANRFRNEADGDRLSYTAQVIDAALGVNVTTAIGDAAATADLKKLKHGQDQRWVVQSRPWPAPASATTVPAQVTAGTIFDSQAFSSGGKSTTVVDATVVPYVPLGSGSWSRFFGMTGGRAEIGPNGPAWVMKAIRTKVDADRTEAFEAIKPQFSVPLHVREKDGSMALWKEGVGVDGLPNVDKQLYNYYGTNATHNATPFRDTDNGGWEIDGAHRSNGMFGMGALQGGLQTADPLVIEEASFFGCAGLNTSSRFDRTRWGISPGSVISFAQGRELAWGIRDMVGARMLIPADNPPNWLPTRADLDVVLDATLTVLEANSTGFRLTFGLPSFPENVGTMAPPNTAPGPTHEYLTFAYALAFRATGNVRFKNALQTAVVNRLANRTLASPKFAFGTDYGVTKASGGGFVPATSWADVFASVGKTSTAADTWSSFRSPDNGPALGDYNIAMFETALIAKNLVGISNPALDSLIALYADKWLNNGEAGNAQFYELNAQWAIKTTA